MVCCGGSTHEMSARQLTCKVIYFKKPATFSGCRFYVSMSAYTITIFNRNIDILRGYKNMRPFKRLLCFLLATSIIITLLPPIQILSLTSNNDMAKEDEEAVSISDLNGTNWMSQIPDERYLHEINIPGTHDGSMAVIGTAGNISDKMYEYARTQTLTVKEQLNAGVRAIDFRMTHEETTSSLGRDVTIDHGYGDDVVFLVHGKPVGPLEFRFYSLKHSEVHRGMSRHSKTYYYWNMYCLQDALNDAAGFLREHPTETVIYEIGLESDAARNGAETYRRARKLLDKWASTINPSTGKPYIYTDYSKMPKLSEVRGQIFILSKDAVSLGYGAGYSTPNGWGAGGVTIAGQSFSYENHWEASAEKKLEYVRKLFLGGEVGPSKDYSDTQRLDVAQLQDIPLDPRDHSKITHGNIVCTTSNQAFADKTKLGDSPENVADYVKGPLFLNDDALFKGRGKLFGWIYSDFVTADTVKTLWRSNYPETEEYANVTYDKAVDNSLCSGTMKSAKVRLGSGYTLRECGYSTKFYRFEGWKVGDDAKIYRPGDCVYILKDTTIEPVWRILWDNLAEGLGAAPDGQGKVIEIGLSEDVTASGSGAMINVPEGKKVILDLGGHTIDASAIVFDGKHPAIFRVNGSLTVKNGTIKSGVADLATFLADPAGSSDCSLELDNVTIDFPGSMIGNAVMVKGNGKVIVNDSVLKGPEGSLGGRDIWLDTAASVTLGGTRTRVGLYFANLNIENNLAVSESLADGAVSISLGNDTLTDKILLAPNYPGQTQAQASWFVSSDKQYEITADDYSRLLIGPGQKHTVTYRVSYGDTRTEKVGDGGTASRPSDPRKDSPYRRQDGTYDRFSFDGWYTTATGASDKYDFSKPVTSDIDLYGYFTATVTFDLNAQDATAGGMDLTKTVRLNDRIAEPSAKPVRDGYEFLYWATRRDGKYEKYDFTSMVDRPKLTLYAVWQKSNLHTVTFVPGEGMESCTRKVKDGEKVGMYSVDYAGHDLEGWYDGDIRYDFNTPVTSDITLTAKWEETVFDVSFYLDWNGSFLEKDKYGETQYVKSGDKVTMPVDPTVEGKTFICWVWWGPSRRSLQSFRFVDPVTKATHGSDKTIQIYALYQSGGSGKKESCKVTFDTGGGSYIAPGYIAEGDTVVRPDPDPVREGYTFGGWRRGSAEGEIYDFNEPVRSDLTLYAGWTRRSHTVSFDTGGAQAIASQTVYENEKATQPDPAPVMTGYKLIGWFEKVTENGEIYYEQYDFDRQVTSELELCALWEEDAPSKVGVTFDANGAAMVPGVEADYGKTVNRPSPDPVISGRSFLGWYEMLSGEDQAELRAALIEDPDLEDFVWADGGSLLFEYDFDTPVFEPLTLRARWSETYTVTFDSGGGAVVPQTVEEGSCAVRPRDPERDGLLFMGWYRNESDELPYDFDTPVTEDIRLTARWWSGEVSGGCKVTFDSAGAPPVPAQTVTAGQTAIRPADPVRPGYIFTGWFITDSDDGGIHRSLYDFSFPVNRDIALTAVWEEDAVYEVTFVWDALDAYTTTAAVRNNTKLPLPDGTGIEGYTFEGWYTDGSFGTKYDFDTPVTSAMTLYGRWTPVKHKVTFDTMDRRRVEDAQVEHGKPVGAPSKPSSPGFEFRGWYVPFIEKTSENEEITPELLMDEAREYADKNFGPGTPDYDKDKYDQFIEGYREFYSSLWYEDGDALIEYDFEDPVLYDMTLYGRWEFAEEIEITRRLLAGAKASDSIRLAELLPAGVVASSYEEPVLTVGSEDGYVNRPAITNGVLTYTVSGDSDDFFGGISVVAHCEKFGDLTLRVSVITGKMVLKEEKAADTDAVCLKKEMVTGNRLTLYPEFADKAVNFSRVVWYSDYPGIASVTPDGAVRALSAGETYIRARSEEDPNITASCLVIVRDVTDSVSISKSSLSLGVGESVQLDACVLPYSAGQSLLWSANNSNVSIEEDAHNGVVTVTGVSAGRCVVTAATKDGSRKKATCRITVGNPVGTFRVYGKKNATAVAAGRKLGMQIEWTGGVPANKDVYWSVECADDPNADVSSIAVISSKGVLSARGEGKVVVRAVSAADPKKTAYAGISVYIPVKKVGINTGHAAISLAAGANDLRLEALVTSAVNGKQATGPAIGSSPVVTWSGGNEYIRVSSDGTVRALGTGDRRSIKNIPVTGTVKAFGGYEKKVTCKVTVVDSIPLKGIRLNVNNLTLGKGNVSKLTATLNPINPDGDTGYIFESSNKNIARVDSSGNVTAIAPGEAVITVTTKGTVAKRNGEKTAATATCRVKVTQSIDSITITNGKALSEGQGLAVGRSFRLKTALTMTEGRRGAAGIVWKSSDESVATVARNGSVKGISGGVAEITAFPAETRVDRSGIQTSVSVVVYEPVKGFKLDRKKLTVGSGDGGCYGKVMIAGLNPSYATYDTFKCEVSGQNVRVAAAAPYEEISDATFADAGTSALVKSNEVIALKGLSPGIVTLTVRSTDGSGKKARCRITVLGNITSLRLKEIPEGSSNGSVIPNYRDEGDTVKYTGRLRAGCSIKLTPVMSINGRSEASDRKAYRAYRKYTDTSVSYRSSNTNVIAVDAKGVVTAKGSAGDSATVYIESADERCAAEYFVTID